MIQSIIGRLKPPAVCPRAVPILLALCGCEGLADDDADAGVNGFGAGQEQVDPGPPPLPTLVTIVPQSIIAGPGRSNGTEWDGNGSIPQADIAEAASALATQNYAAMAAIAAGWAQQGWGAPDIVGTISLESGGVVVGSCTIPSRTAEDSYVVDTSFCRFEGVPFNGGNVSLIFSLRDEDALNDDPIDPVTVSRADILSAFEARDSYAVKSEVPIENALPDILYVRIKVDEFTGGAGETGGADGAGGMAPPPNGGTLPPEGGTLPPNAETGCVWDEACGDGFVVCFADAQCLPDGDGDGCPDSFVGDGQCDEPTNNTSGLCPMGTDSADCAQ